MSCKFLKSFPGSVPVAVDRDPEVHRRAGSRAGSRGGLRLQLNLHSFATGLKRDWDAVLAGLTTPHNSGAVEGNANRKMIKRQMYGRASLNLLPVD